MTPIKIRPKRIGYLVPLPFIFLLMFLFYKYAVLDSGEGNDTIFFIAGIFVLTVGAFLSGYFILQFIRNPTLFRMDDEGFEYAPAGVNMGFIAWKDVKEVEEVRVKVVRGDVPTYEIALAIILKDPDAYRKRFNSPLRALMKVSENRNKGTLLIEPASLQGRYEEVKTFIETKVKNSGFTFS